MNVLNNAMFISIQYDGVANNEWFMVHVQFMLGRQTAIINVFFPVYLLRWSHSSSFYIPTLNNIIK